MFSRLSLAATRSLSSVTKTSTGLVGLKVHPDPIPALIGANEKLLEMVKGVPEDAAYRRNVEAICNFRIDMAANAIGETYDDKCMYIERNVNMGQIEELLVQASDEENVINCYIENKMWEGTGDAIISYERSFTEPGAEETKA